MKQLLLVNVFFLLAAQGFTQTKALDSFYTIGAKWTEYAYFNAGQGQSGGSAFKYTIVKDSIINGWTYHILQKEKVGDYILWTTPSPPVQNFNYTYFDYGLTGGLRLSGQNVYFLDFTKGADSLIYDFAVIPGNTVFGKVVQSTDSVMMSNGSYQKRIWFVSFPNTLIQDYWIEGPGSWLGLLGSKNTPYPTNNNFYRTLCYKSSNIGYNYPDSPFPLSWEQSCLENVTSVDPIDRVVLKCYPNPFGSQFTITISGKEDQVESINVRDIYGRECTMEYFVDAAKNRILVQPNVANGMYVLEAKFHDGTSITTKLIKQN